jgi:hypothetical protein
MIGFIAPCIFTTRDYRQYSALAILHTLQFTVAHALGFSVFTSRNLATDLSQSPYRFKSYMKSSLHHLIPFLPFLLNELRQQSPKLDPILCCNCQLRNSTQISSDYCSVLPKRPSLSLYNPSARTPRKTPSSVFKEACLQLRHLEMDILLL